MFFTVILNKLVHEKKFPYIFNIIPLYIGTRQICKTLLLKSKDTCIWNKNCDFSSIG